MNKEIHLDLHLDVHSESNVCLICLEECDTEMKLECCGNFKLHKMCYTKWINTNNSCLICRNPVIIDPEILNSEIIDPEIIDTEIIDTEIVNSNFVTDYITLARIKLIIYFYLTIALSCLNLMLFCIFKENHCGLN